MMNTTSIIFDNVKNEEAEFENTITKSFSVEIRMYNGEVLHTTSEFTYPTPSYEVVTNRLLMDIVKKYRDRFEDIDSVVNTTLIGF